MMNYSGEADSVFCENGEVVHNVVRRSGVDQGSPDAGPLFAAASFPLCAGTRDACIGLDAIPLWIWDDSSIAGAFDDCWIGYSYIYRHSRKFGLMLHEFGHKLTCYLPEEAEPDVITKIFGGEFEEEVGRGGTFI